MRTLATPEYQLPKFVPEVDKTHATAKIISAVPMPELKAESEPKPAEIIPAVMVDHEDEPAADNDPEEISDAPVMTETADQNLPSPEEPKVKVSFSSAAANMPKNLVDLTNTKASPIKKAEIIDLTSETPKAVVTTVAPPAKVTVVAPKVESSISLKKPAASTNVIKNKSDVNGLMKLIGIGVLSFIVTVGIGVGVGLGLVMFTNKQPVANPFAAIFAKPTPQPSPTTAPVVTPTATPAAKIDPAAEKVLVVNATTIAGHAGKVAAALKTGGFTQVKTGNAQGKYDKGVYLLTKSTNPALVEAIKTMTGLTSIQVQDNMTAEDPKAEYTLVLVLAE